MERNYYNENPSRRMQPNTDRYSRWSEDDDRMDRDDRYARDDSEYDRFNKYTRGAPYSTYGNMSHSTGSSDSYRGAPSDFYRDQGRNLSDYGRDGQHSYSRPHSSGYEQTPYQNFGRSQNFSDQSRNSGWGPGGTHNYGSSPSGYSAQNQYGSHAYGPSYGSEHAAGNRGMPQSNQGSHRYNSGFNPGMNQYGTQSNGYGNQNYGYSSSGDFVGSSSNYGRFGNESYGSQAGYGAGPYGSEPYRGQSYSSGAQQSDWGRSPYQQSSWSQGDRGMSSRAGRAPKGYKRSDERIKEEVCDLLTSAPHVDPSELEVKVSSGEVTLTGTVEDRLEKRMAEDLASTISGVSEVHNQLRVSGQYERSSGSRGSSSSSLSDSRSEGAKPSNSKSVQ